MKKIRDPWLEEDLHILAEHPAFDQEAFRDKTFFITGATGLIGSLMVKALLYLGEQKEIPLKVIAFIRNQEKAETIFRDFSDLRYAQLEFLTGELTQSIHVDGPVDFILHAASPVGSKYFMTNPVETIQACVSGTDQVLALAAEKRSQGVVYVSSMEIYGRPDPSLELVKEADLGSIDPLSIRSCYSEGKRICECLCASYASEYRVPVCSARLAQTFGAGVLPGENRVFAQFARSVIRGTDIILHTDGSSEGNYCYTRDTIAALLLLLQKGQPGEAYTVVNERTHTTIAGMAQMVARDLAKGKIQVVFDIPKDQTVYGYAPGVRLRLSGEKLRSLGWEPQVDLAEAYQRMIKSMQVQEEG